MKVDETVVIINRGVVCPRSKTKGPKSQGCSKGVFTMKFKDGKERGGHQRVRELS